MGPDLWDEFDMRKIMRWWISECASHQSSQGSTLTKKVLSSPSTCAQEKNEENLKSVISNPLSSFSKYRNMCYLQIQAPGQRPWKSQTQQFCGQSAVDPTSRYEALRCTGCLWVSGCSHILNDEKNPGKRGPEFDVALRHRTQVDSGRRFQGLNNLFTSCGANYVHRTNCASMQRILESFALHDSANPQNAEGEVARTCGDSESCNYLEKMVTTLNNVSASPTNTNHPKGFGNCSYEFKFSHWWREEGISGPHASVLR